MTAACFASYLFTRNLEGPDLLAFYVVTLIVTLIGSTLVRRWWQDIWAVSITGCVLYETVGVIRYVTGRMAGMHRFDFLFLMMTIRGLLFFLRAKDDGGYGVGGGCAIGGCGAGGCGGGGGCGGCGGGG